MADEPQMSASERDELAGEYALGVLAGAERARAARLAQTDRGFALAVARWQEALTPLAEGVTEIRPPAAAKSELERRLFGAPARWFDSLLLWRAAAVAASVAAIALGATLYDAARPPPYAPLIAAIQTEAGAAQYVALVDRETATLTLARIDANAAPAAGRDHELWLIEGGNAPVSLGVLDRASGSRLVVAGDLARKLVAGVTFAVSDEPLGGSPTGKPTGAVLALGAVREL
jgi:anti-sigma-K factor RskA